LQPWIKAMSSPQLAGVALKLNPPWLSYSLLSNANPMMRAVVPLAEKARAERTVPDADNPFVAMQQQFSKAMIDALNLYRDARDQLTEQIGMTGRIIGMHTFGASAPLNALQKKFGFEPSQVVTAAKEQLAIGEAARVLRVDKIRDLRGA
jgi:pyruvate dehydrogenase complex dehydrogenase (E1) component